MTDISGIFPKKSPIGVYDKNILCRDCEDKFQNVDEYAQNILLQQEDSHKPLLKENKTIAYQVEDIDHDLLKLFFISVLWRASVSTHDFYSKVNLGPFEQVAKDLIWSSNAGDEEQFSYVLAKFHDNELGRVMLDPHKERWHGLNYYRFYMYGYVVYIKVDKQKTPEQFRPFLIDNNRTLTMIARDIRKSSELPVMISIAKEARN